MPRPSAAQALFPHLKSDQRPEQQPKRTQTNLAGSMYPQLTAEQKAWDEFRKRDRQALLEALRAVNGRGKRQ